MRRARIHAAAAAAGVLACVAIAARAGPAEDYMLHCMGCHGADARGVAGKVPPLAVSLGRFMRTPAGRSYLLRVPGAANSALTDAQLAAVLNWLAERYAAADDPRALPFTVEEVSRERHTPLTDVKETRRQVVRELAASGLAPPAEY